MLSGQFVTDFLSFTHLTIYPSAILLTDVNVAVNKLPVVDDTSTYSDIRGALAEKLSKATILIYAPVTASSISAKTHTITAVITPDQKKCSLVFRDPSSPSDIITQDLYQTIAARIWDKDDLSTVNYGIILYSVYQQDINGNSVVVARDIPGVQFNYKFTIPDDETEAEYDISSSTAIQYTFTITSTKQNTQHPTESIWDGDATSLVHSLTNIYEAAQKIFLKNLGDVATYKSVLSEYFHK